MRAVTGNFARLAAPCDETTIDRPVDVWCFPPASDIAGDALSVLDEEERGRAATFIRAADRDAFITARAALRHVVAAAVGDQPAAIRFVRNRFGKLLLSDRDRHPDLDFSVSHASGLCVIALSRSGAVGVDVERRRDVADRRQITASVFGDKVAGQLAAAGRRENDVFLRLWTAAEALVKATGRGFAGTRGRIPMSLAADGSPRIDVGEPCQAAEWTLCAMDLLPGYVGSLVVRNVGPRRQHYRLTRTSFPSLATNSH
jgi:4'-phosphopantetheinyl transferase